MSRCFATNYKFKKNKKKYTNQRKNIINCMFHKTNIYINITVKYLSIFSFTYQLLDDLIGEMKHKETELISLVNCNLQYIQT